MRPRVNTALDHAVVLVEDLAAAARDIEAAGFTVTPETLHSPEMGTANRCVMLDSTYIELLTVVRPTERNAGWRDLLSAGPGLKGLALKSADLDATRDRLLARHVPAGPALSFSRETEGGVLRFSVIRIERAATPGLQVLICRHHTPDLMWTPRWCTHGNAATELSGLTVPCPDPAATAAIVEAAGTDGGTVTAITLAREDEAPGRVAVRLAGPAAAREIDLTGSCGIVLELIPS